MSGAGLVRQCRQIARELPPLIWLAMFVQTVFLFAALASDGYDAARTGEWLRLVLTYATVIALFGLPRLLVGSGPRRSVAVGLLVYFVFVTINFVRFETAGSFDYGFLHENIREMATPLGRHIILTNVSAWELVTLFILPLAAGVVVARRPSAARRPVPPRARAALVVACAVLLFALPAARVSTHESLTGFAASAVRFFAEARTAEAAVKGAQYPFVRDFVPSERALTLAKPTQRPHVILLFMESWSARYANRTRADGVRLTPVFDTRRREGLTFDHFYGNSVQSSRGHFATLCSLIPMYRHKEFVAIPDTRLHCLPTVLGEAGYRTFFYSATDEPDFDQSDKFFARIGFSRVKFAEPREQSKDPAMWGVGVQDDVFYKRFFSMLDEELAREPDAPIFAVAANASNHYPFDKNPKHVPDPSYPTKYQRNYVASLRAADAWLETFFTELDRREAFRESIVILVGDHSFPADEHGIHFNGLGAFEEAFHTSFLLRWKGHVLPQVDETHAASQIDIAPTIADLLGLRHRTHFVGRSLVDDTAVVPPVPLVQPYDGGRLVALRWPLKLERHEAANQEHLYDLSTDPDEEHDRIRDPRFANDLAALRETIVRIRASQVVIRANRVWP